MIFVRDVRIIAAQELKVNLRQRWTLVFAVVFAALSLAISYFGLITQAIVGFQGFVRTAASLLNLVLCLVPVVALMMASLSFNGEKGVAELLFSQPVTRTSILLGKAAGLSAALGAALLFGFGAAGLLIALDTGSEGSFRYLAFLCFSLLLEMVFIALGAMIAIASSSRARSFGYALFAWFFFVLFYDLLAMGLAFVLNERTSNRLIFVSLFGNPVDLARVGSMLTLADTSIFGATGAALVKALGGNRGVAAAVAACALLLWIALPLFIANRILRRRDI